MPQSTPGGRLGPYVLRRLVGKGGMGEVYEALDERKGRVVALKVLPQGYEQDVEYVERFRREAMTSSRLSEPHVIPIHDFGEIDGRLFIDMRLVDGQDLRSVLKQRGRLSAAEAVDVVTQVAAALDAAHRAGLVHRDVKPENVLVTREGFCYLADFGIARDNDGTSLTTAGATLGTAAYMAPERLMDAPVTGAADTYALACVLHELLTGSTPFGGRSSVAMFSGHLHEAPPSASSRAPSTPAALDEVLARGLSKDPAHRQRSCTELAREAAAAMTSPQNHDSALDAAALDAAATTAAVPRPAPAPGPARTEPPAAPSQYQAESPQRGSKAGRGALAGAAVACAILLAASAGYVLLQDDSDDQTPRQAASSAPSSTGAPSNPVAPSDSGASSNPTSSTASSSAASATSQPTATMEGSTAKITLPAGGSMWFSSPSGWTACRLVESDRVTCRSQRHAWSPDDDCQATVTMPVGGKPSFDCPSRAGDLGGVEPDAGTPSVWSDGTKQLADLGTSMPVLPHNRTVDIGGLRCEMTKQHVTCSNGSAWFQIANLHYRFSTGESGRAS